MPLLRETGPLDRYPYLTGLGLHPDDAGRLDVVAGAVDHTGFFVDAVGGEARLLNEGDPSPAGVWIARRDLDSLRPNPGDGEESHGFGEGWGTQGAQLGGDRSYPEEDAGGTIRAPYRDGEETTADESRTR